MYSLTVETKYGQVLELTNNESNYQIINIDGLNPPKATINTTIVAGMDGSKFNSSRLEARNLVITLRLNGDVESNRQLLYRYFRSKQWCKLYYKNENRDVFIEGYVDNVECALFSMSETMQISILCPYPYFKEVQEIIDDISKIQPIFQFPFSINYDEPVIISEFLNDRIATVLNDGDNQTGIIIEFSFSGTVINPYIQNATTGERFTIKGTYGDGDNVVVDTNRGNKKITLYRSGTVTNISNQVDRSSKWLQLETGENVFVYGASTGAELTFITFRHYNIHEGV